MISKSCKNKLIEAIIRFIKVKTLINLVVIGTYCYLAIRNTIPIEQFATVVMIVITYFFNKDINDKN